MPKLKKRILCSNKFVTKSFPDRVLSQPDGKKQMNIDGNRLSKPPKSIKKDFQYL